MKQLLLTIVLAVLVVAATAQETRKTFCQIVGTGKVLSAKIRVQIDFGQKRSYWNQYKNFMVDETGKIVSDDEIREGIITQKDFEDMEKEALKAQENNTPNNDSILDTEEAIRKRYE